jgi:hypothetical protein
MDLDSSNPNQVESAQTISVFLGNPSRTLVVCSGIAIPNWDSQGNLDFLTVRIKLNVQATTLLGSTAVVGLASIENEDSEFTFATNSTHAEIDPSGDIFLVAVIAVQGEPSTLSRFSYQTHLVITKDQPVISGTIQWSDADATVTGNPAYRFTVTAGVMVTPPGGGFQQYVPEVTGHEDTGVGTVRNGVHTVTYSLPIPLSLLGTPLFMRCDPYPGAFTPVHANYFLSVVQVSGPSPVLLTNAQLVEPGVDFAMAAIQPTK